MNFKNLKFGLALIAAVGATCVTAAAQERQKPKFIVQDCVTYLRMFELQHRIIETETISLDMLKDDRAKQAGTASSNRAPADEARQLPPTTAAIDYDIEIGKLAFTIEKDRRVLTAIERRYKECLQAPPWRVAKAVAAPPREAKKPATRRTDRSSQRAPRPAPEEQGSAPPRGGIGSIIGGGGVGFGF